MLVHSQSSHNRNCLLLTYCEPLTWERSTGVDLSQIVDRIHVGQAESPVPVNDEAVRIGCCGFQRLQAGIFPDRNLRQVVVRTSSFGLEQFQFATIPPSCEEVMRQVNRLTHYWDAVCRVLPVIVGGAALALFTSVAVADDSPKVANRLPANNAIPANAGVNSQLTPFLELARKGRDAVASVRDYEAIFDKKELVGRTLYSGRMVIKLRHEPFSVYLRFIDQNNGREVMYAGPRYQFKMMAHEAPGTLAGMVGTVSLEPNSARAMAEGRHPITQIGMVKMMDAVLQQWAMESKNNDPQDPKVFYYPNAKLDGQIECEAAITRHENSQRPFRFYETRVFFEKKSHFPIRLEQYGAPDGAHPQPYLVEQYIYTNIKTNVGLSDNDFDVRNRNYHF
jgi:hypothetical protein